MSAAVQPPRRFHALDVIRGLAALSVVFFHWRHFLTVDGVAPSDALLLQQPWFGVLSVFYDRGWLAVDLFFLLSGFIFYWLYSASIHEGRTGAGEFFWLRFSRLYPLHLLTLSVVIIGQSLYHALTGGHFVYVHDDLYHLVLNLLLASGWGLEHAYSYNGPIWSVSTECALYFMFFVLCRLQKARAPVLFGLSLVFFSLGVFGLLPGGLPRGGASFFLGGVLYLGYARILRAGAVEFWSRVSIVGALVAWAIGIVGLQVDLPQHGPIYVLLSLYPRYVMFPLTVLAFALIETQRGSLGQRWAWIGDLSYSSYLLHFPLQLLLAIVFAAMGWSMQAFLSPLALCGFFVLLIGASLASYHLVERPAQRFLRGLMEDRRRRRRRRRASPWALTRRRAPVQRVRVLHPPRV